MSAIVNALLASLASLYWMVPLRASCERALIVWAPSIDAWISMERSLSLDIGCLVEDDEDTSSAVGVVE